MIKARREKNQEAIEYDFFGKSVMKMHIFDVPASKHSMLQCNCQTL